MIIRNGKFLAVAAASMLFQSLSAAGSAPFVRDITARPGAGRKINVLWTLPDDMPDTAECIYIYRNTVPIKNSAVLETSEKVAEVPAETFCWTDTVSDYRDYFYAVMISTPSGDRTIFMSMNSTARGVRLARSSAQAQREESAAEKEKIYSAGELRETPLPKIKLDSGTDSRISDSTARAAMELAPHGIPRKTQEMQPYFFEEDMISPDGGDAFLLFNILRGTFAGMDYDGAISGLRKLTGTKISEEVQNRALFYLGESYYFTGRYADAVRTFLKITEVYPVAGKKWLDASLDRIEMR